MSKHTEWELYGTPPGWFGSAALLGGFGKEAQGGRTGPAAITAAKCWALGTTVCDLSFILPILCTIWMCCIYGKDVGHSRKLFCLPQLSSVAEAHDRCVTGCQVGVALRSLSRGYFPDKAFVIVSFAVTAVFLIGWRSALAAATPEVCNRTLPLLL